MPIMSWFWTKEDFFNNGLHRNALPRTPPSGGFFRNLHFFIYISVFPDRIVAIWTLASRNSHRFEILYRKRTLWSLKWILTRSFVLYSWKFPVNFVMPSWLIWYGYFFILNFSRIMILVKFSWKFNFNYRIWSEWSITFCSIDVKRSVMQV